MLLTLMDREPGSGKIWPGRRWSSGASRLCRNLNVPSVEKKSRAAHNLLCARIGSLADCMR